MTSTSSTPVEEQRKATRFNVSQVSTSCDVTSSSSVTSPDVVLSANQMTADFLQPKTEYYRMTNPAERPPIDSVGYRRHDNDGNGGQAGGGGNPVKFGWIIGVLVRSTLNIWGVMLFLRLFKIKDIAKNV